MEPATAADVQTLSEILAETQKMKKPEVEQALAELGHEDHDGDLAHQSVGNLRALLATLRLQKVKDGADTADVGPDPEPEPEAEEAEEADGEVVDEETIGDEVGQALALREQTPQPQSALPSVAEFNASMAIAERISKTSFVPVSYRGRPDDVLAAILFGREIGLGPMQSLRDVYMVDGRPALAAHLQLALLRRGGVSILESEATGERAWIRARRADTGEVMAVEWTYEEASKITQGSRGGGPTRLVDKDNWKNYPADMLFARCVGRLTRRLGSDLIGGLPPYVAEEVADFSGWGVTYGEGGEITLQPDKKQPEARREQAGRVETPKTFAEISEWAAAYGDEIGWPVWVADAAERLFGVIEASELTVDQKKILGQKAAGAIVKLRDTVDAGRFPPPSRQEIQRAWAAVLDGEILAGPLWRLDPSEDAVPTYHAFHGLPEPEMPSSEVAKEEAVESDGSAEDTEPAEDAVWTEADDIPFGEGYEG